MGLPVRSTLRIFARPWLLCFAAPNPSYRRNRYQGLVEGIYVGALNKAARRATPSQDQLGCVCCCLGGLQIGAESSCSGFVELKVADAGLLCLLHVLIRVESSRGAWVLRERPGEPYMSTR